MDIAAIMSPDPVVIGPGASPDEALQLMDEQDVRHLPVVEDGKLIGVISDRDLLGEVGWVPARTDAERAARKNRGGGGGHGTIRPIMHASVTTAEPEDSVVSAAVDLVVAAIGCLPVVKGGDLVGIVTEMDLAAAYWRVCQKHNLEGDVDPPVSRLMANEPVTASFGTTLSDATGLCSRHGIRHLPVVDGTRLVGVLSDRDLRAASASGSPGSHAVGTIMVPFPVTLTADQTLSEAAEIMVGHRISCLPVVEGARLTGILTLTDILDHCLSTLRDPEPN